LDQPARARGIEGAAQRLVARDVVLAELFDAEDLVDDVLHRFVARRLHHRAGDGVTLVLGERAARHRDVARDGAERGEHTDRLLGARHLRPAAARGDAMAIESRERPADVDLIGDPRAHDRVVRPEELLVGEERARIDPERGELDAR
jgi:hypothetical protein